MEIIKYLKTKFTDLEDLNNVFVGTPPYPMITLDDFLPDNFALKLNEECQSIPDQYWTRFTRNGSHMVECKSLEHTPVAFQFVNEMHSSLGLDWLKGLTGIRDLIPDPYLVGAGKVYRRA